jgi:hypothetical protein
MNLKREKINIHFEKIESDNEAINPKPRKSVKEWKRYGP